MKDMIYLCFPWLESNVCRYGDEPLGITKRTNDSTHDHGMTSVIASESKVYSQFCREISGFLFVVGDGVANNRSGHNYAEFYEDENTTWTEVEKFPFSVTVDISESFQSIETRKCQKLGHLIESRGKKTS